MQNNIRNKNLNKYIDHTLLKANATKDDIKLLCLEAKTHDFASVCVNPCWVSLAKKLLKHTTVGICTVIGFPLGATTTKTKVAETREAIKNGASEIDMVANIADIIEGNDINLLDEINAVKKACRRKKLKVIVETALLSEQQKRLICNVIKLSNADYIKTSTGFSTDGARVEDIKLFKNILKNTDKKVKASGGIKNYRTAVSMINAGADRIGTSNSINIINQH